jgi:hypothetical protein
MQFQVFIQTTAEQHFTASVIGMPIALVAEGTTEAEALGRARAMLDELLATGKFVTVDLSPDLLKKPGPGGFGEVNITMEGERLPVRNISITVNFPTKRQQAMLYGAQNLIC